MVTRIWHGATSAAKSDEYLTLMRTVAIEGSVKVWVRFSRVRTRLPPPPLRLQLGEAILLAAAFGAHSNRLFSILSNPKSLVQSAGTVSNIPMSAGRLTRKS
jgi:hypothetical protein